MDKYDIFTDTEILAGEYGLLLAKMKLARSPSKKDWDDLRRQMMELDTYGYTFR